MGLSIAGFTFQSWCEDLLFSANHCMHTCISLQIIHTFIVYVDILVDTNMSLWIGAAKVA